MVQIKKNVGFDQYFSIEINRADIICWIPLFSPQTPGSRGLLPAPSPLRTVRDSFPSHSSSPSKASLGIEATRRLKIPITFAIHTDSQNPFRWRAHGSHNVASFAFPSKIGSASFLATKHPTDVCTLTGRVMSSFSSQPVSTPLQDGLRFFRPLSSYLP